MTSRTSAPRLGRARIVGGTVAAIVALLAIAEAALLIAPQELLEAYGIPNVFSPGDGPADTGAAGIAWMAWTEETGAFFLFIVACLGTMTALEMFRPGGAERDGVLGLTTTRGDRLFISLLGTAYILLAWLGVMGTPLWGGVGIAVLWWVFVFWKV